ncbi:MAG: hypothetical protein ACKPKO_13500, partial [Candidatus Fonsibacter sp.]
MMLSVRLGRIAVEAVGYDVVQVVRLVVADPLRRQVAVSLPVRSVVCEAVAARAAGLADAAHEPLLGYEACVVDGPVGLLVLQLGIIPLPSKFLYQIILFLGALVVVVKVDLLEVRRLGEGGVE